MALTKVESVSIERGRFAYRERGEAGGPVVVMLHGWPESSYCWEPVCRYLKSGLRVIAPDLRGLGDSDRSTELAAYRKQALAQDMVALLDALGVGEFQLVGHDWGGVVAQEVALAIPERVSRLVLMNIHVINNLCTNS